MEATDFKESKKRLWKSAERKTGKGNDAIIL